MAAGTGQQNALQAPPIERRLRMVSSAQDVRLQQHTAQRDPGGVSVLGQRGGGGGGDGGGSMRSFSRGAWGTGRAAAAHPAVKSDRLSVVDEAVANITQ